VTLWGIMGGELLATLVKTGPNQVSLTMPNSLEGGSLSGSRNGPCQYQFKVSPPFHLLHLSSSCMRSYG
jgi:hypothetical protein